MHRDGWFGLRSATMPRQADDDGTIASVVVIIFFIQPGGDQIIDFLVVLFGRRKDTTRLL